jgi:hypothetical protein
MKAEHRHQLQTNILADKVGKVIQGMKSGPKSTTVAVWGVVFVVIIGIILWQYTAAASQSRQSAEWQTIDKAMHDPAKGMKTLEEIASEDETSLTNRTARFQLARIRFSAGQAGLTGADRADAIKVIQEARNLYEKLRGQCADAPLLEQEASFGYAKALEALTGVTTPTDPAADLAAAIGEYKALAKKYPDSPLGKSAAKRVEELEGHSAEIAKFYKELAELPISKMPPPMPLFPPLEKNPPAPDLTLPPLGK